MIKMMTDGKKTVALALLDAFATLKTNDTIDTPRLDAEILLCYVLNCERIDLVINKDTVLDENSVRVFNDYINRRVKNEPISYITEKKEFMSLNFYVTDGILIPRPDTEILVEEIIKIYKDKDAKILDLCTGSGAIAVSLAHYLNNATLTAVDKFDICIKTASKNAIINNVADRVNVVKKDVLEPFDVDGDFDCIVSNPPYIKTDVLSTLSKDVKDFEPMYALDGGNDGLIFYRKITDFALKKLKSGGILAFEIGFDQGLEVQNIIKDTHSFKEIKLLKDLADLDRVIIAEKE